MKDRGPDSSGPFWAGRVSNSFLAAQCSRQLVYTIERSLLVALRQGRIVKHRIDEVLHRPLENEYRLADVQKF